MHTFDRSMMKPGKEHMLMTRQQRRTINRANAKLSTGPTTETGKDASKMGFRFMMA